MDGEDGMPSWRQVERLMKSRQLREDVYDVLTFLVGLSLFVLAMWLA